MSQQMFEPEENQQQGQQGQQEQQGQQRWWASEPSRKNHKTRETPKNEHPSTFEEPFAATFPYDTLSHDTVDGTIDSTGSTAPGQDGEKISYQAGYTGHTGYTGNAGNSGQYSYGPDGDAMESGYRPYNAYRPTANASAPAYVPPWARPQRNSVGRILAKVIVILLVGMLILKVIIPLLIVLFAFAAIVTVIILVGLLVFGVFILGFLRLLGIRVPLRPRRFMNWRRGQGRWRHRYFDL